MSVAILTDRQSVREGQFLADKFVNYLNEANVDAQVVYFEDLIFFTSPERALIVDSQSGKDLADFHVAYAKRTTNIASYAQACALYMTKKNKKFFDQEHLSLSNVAANKLLDHVLFWYHGFQFPPTLMGEAQTILSCYNSERFTLRLPAVFKSLLASRGANNHLIRSEAELTAIVESNPTTPFALQRWVPNQGEYRIMVVDDAVDHIVLRARSDDSTHQNRVSRGAKAEIIDPNQVPELVAMALEAAKKLHRQIAGLDIIVDQETGSSFILEVNRSPQSESGIYVERKMELISKFLSRLDH